MTFGKLISLCLAIATASLLLLHVQCTLPADYTSKSAVDKQNILWNEITHSCYATSMMDLPTEGYSPANFSKILSPQYDTISYLHKGDEMPGLRMKLIHTYGSVCKVHLKITVTDGPFTGVFKSGGIGLLRMSPAMQNTSDISVGLGLKIFIDGKNSQNFLLMWQRAGQGANRNFFAKDMQNIILKTPATAIDPIFEAAIKLLPGERSENPEDGLNVPLFEQASMKSDGTIVGKVVAPYRVTFRPNQKLGWADRDTTDFRRHLADIPQGTLLYTVFARRGKNDPDVKIGDLVSTGPFMASVYGDHQLFFNHARTPWRL